MATHLAHRLPWASIGEVVKFRHQALKGQRYNKLEEKHEKIIQHFARCFSDALQEFAASDQSAPEEKQKFDPTTWNIHPRGFGGYMGYYPSLMQGYFQLNLILMDPQVFLPIVLRNVGGCTWAMQVLCGSCDGGHPEWLANHIRDAFTERGYLKPLTADVVQILRDHCALLFRCLYSVSGENRALNPELAAEEFRI